MIDDSVTVTDLAQYVRHIECHFKDGPILYRGQREDMPLLPKLARLRLTLPLLEAERRMFEEFRRQSIPFLDYEPSTEWDWLALMQHHGLPTRLLDWTLNPLAALWFAVSKPAEDSSRGVVWAFVPSRDDIITPTQGSSPFEGGRTLVFQPSHVTRRIVAQSGCFTVHKYIHAKKHFIRLELNKNYSSLLTKYVIPASCFADLRFCLSNFGVNAVSLFPDLDGLSKRLRWLYALETDETVPRQSSQFIDKSGRAEQRAAHMGPTGKRIGRH